MKKKKGKISELFSPLLFAMFYLVVFFFLKSRFHLMANSIGLERFIGHQNASYAPSFLSGIVTLFLLYIGWLYISTRNKAKSSLPEKYSTRP